MTKNAVLALTFALFASAGCGSSPSAPTPPPQPVTAQAAAAPTPTVTPAPVPAPTHFMVSGTVTDGTSGGVLPNIRIVTDSGVASVLTDASGRYVLLNVPSGTTTLTLSAISYATASRTVTVAADTIADFVLQRVPPPPAVFSVSLTCVVASHGSDTQCTVQASYGGAPIPSYALTAITWNWGDGHIASPVIIGTGPNGTSGGVQAPPTAGNAYAQPGTYTVVATVTATTVDGSKTTTVTQTIVVP